MVKSNKKGEKMKTLIAITMAVLLIGCATVKKDLDKPSFQGENQPIRTLKVAAFLDYRRNPITDNLKVTEQDAIDAIKEVSKLSVIQTGIDLEIVRFIPMRWRDYWNISRVLPQMHYTLIQEKEHIGYMHRQWGKPWRDWDIAIAFGTRDTEDIMVGFVPLWGGKIAVIDDIYRRYIVTKDLSPEVILHEIYHCFIFTIEHGGGIMTPFMFEIVPTVRLVPMSKYLTPGARKEILKNKWRNFTIKPKIERIQDTIYDKK